MNSSEIRKILKSDAAVAPTFLGVFPIDRLPNIQQRQPSSLVANTDTSDGPGKHWLAMYFDGQGKGIYFDSYGQGPCTIFEKFMEKNSYVWRYNTIRLQGPVSSTCGQYCIYFLVHVCRGHSLKEVTDAFDGHSDNDEAVTDFVNNYFNVDTEVLDTDYFFDAIKSI